MGRSVYRNRIREIERVFGDVHDKCTRNHTRRRLRTLVVDVEEHLAENGLRRYRLSVIYYTTEVDRSAPAALASLCKVLAITCPSDCRLTVPRQALAKRSGASRLHAVVGRR